MPACCRRGKTSGLDATSAEMGVCGRRCVEAGDLREKFYVLVLLVEYEGDKSYLELPALM